MIMALVSQNVCGYSFSTISDIVKTQSDKRNEFKQFMREINKDMNNKNINILLQHKVTKYIEYQYNENIKKSSYETNILEILPDQLKEEVLIDVNKEMISHINYLSKLSKECQKEISLQIKQKVFFPGEIIFKIKEFNDNVYYICQGTVALSLPVITKNDKIKSDQEMNVQILKEYDVFGQQGFLFNHQNPYTAKTTEMTVLSYLNRHVFKSIINKYKKDYEKYSEMHDKILLYQDYSIIKERCFSCGEQTHQLDSCPFVKMKINYNQKKTFGTLQRVNIERRKEKKPKSFQPQELTQNALDVISGLDQSVISDALQILNQTKDNFIDEIEEDSKYYINLQEVEEINTKQQSQSHLIRFNKRPKTLKPITKQGQYMQDGEDKMNKFGRQLQHAQSFDVIKNHNQLDVIRENFDDEQLLASQTPQIKKKVGEVENPNIERFDHYHYLFPVLKQNKSDINYSTKESDQKSNQILQNHIQKYELNNEQSPNNNQRQLQLQLKDHSNMSIEVPRITNLKSNDSIQNSLDLQIQQSNINNINSQEQKTQQNDELFLSSSHGNDINSQTKKNVNSLSRSPNKNDTNSLSYDSQKSIEHFSGPKKRNSGILLFSSRQNNLKKHTVISAQSAKSFNQEESCDLRTEKDIEEKQTPNDIYQQILLKRQNKYHLSQIQFNQEIYKRREEKRQSTFLKHQINEASIPSLRNITSSNNMRLKQYFQPVFMDNYNQQPQSNQSILSKQSQQNIHMDAVKFERKQQKTYTQQSQELQYSALSPTKKQNKRDSQLFLRNTTNSTFKQILQPYSMQSTEKRNSLQFNDFGKSPTYGISPTHRDRNTIFRQIMSLKSQTPSDILQQMSQNSKQGSGLTHNLFGPPEIKSRFKLMSDLQQKDVETNQNIIDTHQEKSTKTLAHQSEKQHIEEQIKPTNVEEENQNDLDDNVKYNTEFQLRCQIGLQDLDLLVLRKFYMIAQQTNKKIVEIGKEQDYILVEDNEMDIDQIYDFTFYFPLKNFRQFRMKYCKTQSFSVKKLKTKNIRKNQSYQSIGKNATPTTIKYSPTKIIKKIQN